MAHHFPIDVELVCKVGRVTWMLARAAPFSWRENRNRHEKYLGMVITSPQALAGTKCWLREGIPNDLRQELLTGNKRLSPESRRLDFEVLVGVAPRGEKGSPIKLSPWILRDEFLQLKRTNQALVAFLNKCGDWGEPQSFWGHRDYNEREIVRICDPKYFWKCREELVQAIHSGKVLWDDLPYSSNLKLQRREKFPHLFHLDVYCFDVLMHTVLFDLLRGVSFRLCARHDCAIPFPIQSGHKQEYCQQYCAHLASVRRQRLVKRKKQT